jgi:SNF2 family DNA or RNA helicase
LFSQSGFFSICRTKDGNPRAVELGLNAAEELSSKLYQILIERKKEEVLKDDLPSKDERIVFCELSPLQVRAFEAWFEQTYD